MSKKKFSFDDSLKELEKIVEKLEKGNNDLEENLNLYEKGMDLCRICKQNLNDAKLKIETIGFEDEEKEKDNNANV